MPFEREVLDVDVIFVGAGPASLVGALHLQKLLAAKGQADTSIAIIEKGREVHSHALSGAVFIPRAIRELYPDFDTICPIPKAEVTKDSVYFLTEKSKLKFPITPPPLQNHGSYVLSLQNLVAWLGQKVEEAGINLFPSFPGAELLYENDAVVGVRTRDQGIDKEGKEKANYTPGVDIRAKVTVLGEGPRGTLAKTLIDKKGLQNGRSPQVYAIGVKEVWEAPHQREGEVLHTMGFPLDTRTMGGGFLYFMPDNLVSLGLIIGLDYQDPFLDPHHELQRLKAHPLIREILMGGKMISYGAKTIPEAGLYAMPQMYTDGCLLIGDTAGFQNVMKLKGIHLAMKSGMLAAETIVTALEQNDFSEAALSDYEQRFKKSWAYDEMRKGRNFHQGWEHGLIPAMFNAGLQFLTNGWGFKERKHFAAGHTHMRKVADYYGEQRRDDKYASLVFDRTLTFDKVTDVFNAYNLHDENQPPHLLVADYDLCSERCTVEYGNPCRHFCPANVYEMVEEHGKPQLHLNPSNCVHCKTCDIMDPYQIITWVPPEGGSGPNYKNL
ncbi:electron transfer flavoprotein-ubiquinone oxidoreductase [candidate division KSB1 bacterium]|nr:electron transfer flavoprotein-ubiquinone oxidoreductase [candidate division KSB1 bacterium]